MTGDNNICYVALHYPACRSHFKKNLILKDVVEKVIFTSFGRDCMSCFLSVMAVILCFVPLN